MVCGLKAMLNYVFNVTACNRDKLNSVLSTYITCKQKIIVLTVEMDIFKKFEW